MSSRLLNLALYALVLLIFLGVIYKLPAPTPLSGEGDGERNRIYAEAYTRDRDFFEFYRSMQAYENSLKSTDTRLLLSPDSEFFKYFTDPSGGSRPAQSSIQ